MTEWFYSDRWYNVFRLEDVDDDRLKGWYCNIGRPARLGKAVVAYDDLALDVFVTPEGGVTVLQQSFDIQPMIQGQADCISVMTYNEYGQALDAGYGPENLTIFNYTEMGNDLLEDGLYVMEETLDDPAKVDAYTRFVKASMKGWAYALENPEEAAQIVVDMDDTGAATLERQLYMVGEVSKLVDATDPALNMETYDRTVKALLDQGIIKAQPEGAYTTVVTDALK